MRARGGAATSAPRPVPRRADHRPRRLDAGQDARLHPRLQRALRRGRAADQPLHGRRGRALPAGGRHRPRPAHLRRRPAGAGAAGAPRQAADGAPVACGRPRPTSRSWGRWSRPTPRRPCSRSPHARLQAVRARRAGGAADRRSHRRGGAARGGDARAVRAQAKRPAEQPRRDARDARDERRRRRSCAAHPFAALAPRGPSPPSCASASPRWSPTAPSSWSGSSPPTCRWSCWRIWHAVAADGPVGRFDQRAFTAYYLGVLAVRLLTSNWAVWQLSMEIRDGTLSAKLLRPIHPILALAAEHLSAVPMRAAVISPVVAILIYSGWDRLLRHDRRALGHLCSLRWSAPGCSIFFSMVLMGSLSFFLESALGIFELWLGVHAIFSGYLVPLEALPRWVRGAADVLPFRFMLGFPVETLVGLSGGRGVAGARRPVGLRGALRPGGPRGLARRPAPVSAYGVEGVWRPRPLVDRPPCPRARRLSRSHAATSGSSARSSHLGAHGDAVPRRLHRARPHRDPVDGA